MPTFDYICEVCNRPGREHRPEKPPRFCSRECMTKGVAGVPRKRPKWIITPEMHDQIRAVYQHMTGDNQVRDVARGLGLPRWKISRYAVHQGWIAKMKKEPDWTEQELKILESSAHLSPENLQKLLTKAGFRRSSMGIILKRKRMRFLSNLKGQSATSVAECFGVDSHCIMRWIGLGYLKAKRRGTDRTAAQGGDQWYIRDKWIRDFIINCVDEIDIRKVDKYWFVDLLAGGNQFGTGEAKIQADVKSAPTTENTDEWDGEQLDDECVTSGDSMDIFEESGQI